MSTPSRDHWYVNPSPPPEVTVPTANVAGMPTITVWLCGFAEIVGGAGVTGGLVGAPSASTRSTRPLRPPFSARTR
jgi:hypothetical protein